MLERALLDADLKEQVRTVRAEWRKSQRGNLLSIIRPWKRYEVEDFFELLVNGVYFHSDPAAREELDALGVPGRWLAKRGMLAVAVSGVMAVAATRLIIIKAFDRDALNFGSR